MLLVRIEMPSRPGSLGAVATAMGELGADISLVEMVEKLGASEVEEFILDLPGSRTVAELVAACNALDGVRVEWVRNYPRGGGIEYDVDLHRRMAADPERAGEILVAAAPLVFRAEWSLLVELGDRPRVVFATPDAPLLDPNALAGLAPYGRLHRTTLPVRSASDPTPQHAVVSPMDADRVVIIGRSDPPFFGSELARLAHVTGATATLDMFDEPQSTEDRQEAHRVPVSAPLYES